MRFAGYVLGGWSLTAAALGLYWARINQRTKRAERSADADERAWE